MKLSQKAAYLKGLTDGLGLDLTAANGKVLNEVVDLIQEMAKSIDSLTKDVKKVNLTIDELDEDLGAVEDIMYGMVIDDDDDEDYDDDDIDDMFELACPSCGEIIVVDETLDPSSIKCPACGDEFDATCGCGCDCCGFEGDFDGDDDKDDDEDEE